MKNLNLLVSVLMPLLSASAANAAGSLEAAKAVDFNTSLGALRENFIAAPAVVQGVDAAPAAQWQVQDYPPGRGGFQRSFGRGGYTFESEAQAARAQTENGLRGAGLVVLASNVYRDQNYPYKYSFRVDYLEDGDPRWPARTLATYDSEANFTFDSDARPEMNRTVANFRAAGYSVVLAEVRRQDAYPYRYFYQVDYIKTFAPAPRPWPRDPRGPVLQFNSGHYRDRFSAQYDLDNFVARYRAEGKEIVAANVVEQGGWFSFRILYRERRGRFDR